MSEQNPEVILPAGIIPVLCYHRFLPDTFHPDENVFSVTPDIFESHLRLFKDRNLNAISLDEYVSIALGRTEASPNTILLTIDDGYVDTLTHALPLAERYGAKLNLFILTGKTGDSGPYTMVTKTPGIESNIESDPRQWEVFNWDELRELQQRGVGIGMHGHIHEAMSEIEPTKLETGLRSGYETFKKELGFAPDSLAFPYGNAKAYTVNNLRLLHEIGFKLIFNTRSEKSKLPHDRNPLPRFVVQQDQTAESIWERAIGPYSIKDRVKLLLRRHPTIAT